MSHAKNIAVFFIVGSWLLQSCSVSKQIHQQAQKILLQDTVINTGHIGISIYDPSTNTYLYNYNADKYFVPASNVKLFTLYAGMKYLGDSLVGLRYTENNVRYTDSNSIFKIVRIFPSGDPTFLHQGFSSQPVFEFLKKQEKVEVCVFNKMEPSGKFHSVNQWGKGWAWDDYMEAYMPTRALFPIYSGCISLKFIRKDSVSIQPEYFRKNTIQLGTSDSGFSVFKNFFTYGMAVTSGREPFKKIPFYFESITDILSDTLKTISFWENSAVPIGDDFEKPQKVIHSQPTDSLLTPMMHNSDNFFGEQTLLMVSNEHLGYMNDEAIIDTLLKTDLKEVPQQPKWVDGSGLSRYNLFTPLSFVYILNKMNNEFGLERLKTILPTGGEGTLKNYYNSDSGFIYAKTGSLSNQITLCGFLVTKKNKLLVFSLLTNNAIGDGWKVRRAYEQFLKKIREQY
jgi:serine-type D-Ala-D-Ala carboxypeptidase/endopeptidase (penicillin-binding protein 4)